MLSRPTIADVARAAGVSSSTVVRVLAKSSQVRDSTKNRVEGAMKELGYYGNSVASQLVSGRPKSVAIVTANTFLYGFANVLHGIEAAARQEGMSSLLTVIDSLAPESVSRAVETVASQAVAGVVVLDFDILARSFFPHLPSYLPTVVVGESGFLEDIQRVPKVISDEYGSIYKAAKHLIDLGHKTIFVIGQPNSAGDEIRSSAVLDALSGAALPAYPVIRAESWLPAETYRITKKILQQYGDRVTAIACPNDEHAIASIRAISEVGLRVPDDISVFGHDDMPLSSLSKPSLTTVKQDFEKLGNASMKLLMGVVNGGEVDDISISTHLVLRESTGPVNPRRGI